jgi:uncharacterized membrane protein required for colicin V production
VNSLYFDLIACFLILLNLALGWRFGIIGRAIALGGLYGGVAAATALGNGLLRFFGGGGAANDLYNGAWTFIGITFGVVAMVEILGGLYRDRVEKVISLMFDRTAGLVAGLVVGLLEVGVIILVAFAVGNAQVAQDTTQQLPSGHQDTAKAVRNSVITSHIAGLDPAMQKFFGPALPQDFSGHLADTTAVSTPSPSK